MFESLLSGRRTGGRSLRAGLHVEKLDDRLVPATLLYDGVDNTVYITGTSSDDYITVLHHGDGTLTASDQTGLTVDFSDVDRLVVETQLGNDVVRYKLDGKLVRTMMIEVDLDMRNIYTGDSFADFSNLLLGGNDRFTGTLNADIAIDRGLYVNVNGGSGDDLITMYGTPTAPARANDHLTDGLAINEDGLRIGYWAVLDLHFDGWMGNDRIFVDYRGDLDGLLAIHANGAWGDDTVSAVVRLDPGSWGRVGRAYGAGAAVVSGFDGTDNLRFHVFDDSGNDRPVNAEIDGGTDSLHFETDVGTRTSNVVHVGGVEDLDTID